MSTLQTMLTYALWVVLAVSGYVAAKSPWAFWRKALFFGSVLSFVIALTNVSNAIQSPIVTPLDWGLIIIGLLGIAIALLVFKKK